MTEKLSHSEFDSNFAAVSERIDNALLSSGRKREEIILLAATKTVDAASVNYAIEKGIEYIGENKVQEFLSKDGDITKNCHRHFIGHLQTNKVKDIVGKVEMIESVDSVKLAREISKCSEKLGTVTDILLEVNIGGEEAKWGFSPENIRAAIEETAGLPAVSIKGLMTVPPICREKEELRQYFKKMYQLFIDIGKEKKDNISMDILSMGMSDDFELAISEGANLIRIGSALFGKRIY